MTHCAHNLTPLTLVGAIICAPLLSGAESPPEFAIDLASAPVEAWITDGAVSGSECTVSPAAIGGESGIRVETLSEFSDVFFDLRKLAGGPIDFTKARFLNLRVYLPEDSWISALKLNFKDEQGNFGGIPEVANRFDGYRNRWITVSVDLSKRLGEFQNWHGDKSPLSEVRFLSINPYCAHQASPSAYFVSQVELSESSSSEEGYDPLVPPLDQSPNVPFRMDFDNDEQLRHQTAYRTFETSYQAFAKGIAGNDTRSVRVKGRPSKKYIAFLPMFDRLTGSPIDFAEVNTISFSYYLVPDGDPVIGSKLFLAGQHWQDILIDHDFIPTFEEGKWTDVTIDTTTLNLERAKGENPVLPNVFELRIDLQYDGERKNIEMWVDNFVLE